MTDTKQDSALSKRVASRCVQAAVFAAVVIVCHPAFAKHSSHKEAGRLQPRSRIAGQASTSSEACDRDCLEGMVNRYLAAILAHAPAQLPVTGNLKFTENGQKMALGDGLWRTASAAGKYRHLITDPQAAQAGFIGTIRENGVGAILALRLAVADRRVTQVETIVVRDRKAAALYDDLAAPDPAWDKAEPMTGRVSRDKLIAAADEFFTGIEKSRSSGVPLDDACERWDNGLQTTHNPQASPIDPGYRSFRPFGLGCAQQLDSHYYSYIARIRNRRYPIVDVARGLVFAIAAFDYPGDIPAVAVPGVGYIAVREAFRSPGTYLVPALFKIRGGKILRIELLECSVPYRMKSGWDAP